MTSPTALRSTRLPRGEIVLLAVAAVNLCWLLADSRALVSRLYLDPDIASAPAIASPIANAPASRVVTLGNYPWYEPLWLMQLTRGLPAHRQLREAAPFLVAAAGIALVVWMAWRSLGTRAAATTGVVLCCTTAGTRFVLLTPNAHGFAFLHGALLGAVLVFVGRQAGRTSPFTLVWLGLALGSLTALGVSDALVVLDSLVPFLVAAVVAWWRSPSLPRRRILLFAFGVAIWALVWGDVAKEASRNARVVPTSYFGITFVPLDQMLPNISVLIGAFAHLGGGDFFGATIDAGTLLALVAAILTLAAAATVVRWCWRAAPTLVSRSPSSGPTGLERELYLVFWAASLLCTVAAFLLSSVPQDVNSSRYLLALTPPG